MVFLRMLPTYVRNQHFYTIIRFVLNKKMCYLINITFSKQKLYSIFKEKGAICQMVPFVTKYCIAIINLVKASGVICHATHLNSE